MEKNLSPTHKSDDGASVAEMLTALFGDPEKGYDEVDRHLSYRRLSSYVDEQMDEVERLVAETHLEFCALCTDQVRGLLKLKEELKRPLLIEPLRNEGSRVKLKALFGTSDARTYVASPASQRASLTFGIIGIVVIIGATFLFLQLWLRPPSGQPQVVAVRPIQPEGLSGSRLGSTSLSNDDKQKDDSPSLPLQVKSTKLLPMARRSNFKQWRPPIRSRAAEPEPAHGEVTEAIALATRTGEIRFPADDLNEVRRRDGMVMKGPSDEAPFDVISPVATLVISDRPLLRWQPVKGANSYVVSISDLAETSVKSWEVKGTTWRVPAKLTRGQAYKWNVLARVGDKEVYASRPPLGEAIFKVLNAQTADRVENAQRRYRGSPLMLGVWYAQAGLLDDAEREFQQLLEKNPASEIAKKLLKRVQEERISKRPGEAEPQ